MDISIDLSLFAGKSVKLELENRLDEWAYKGCYWADLAIVGE
jgi:hypothetical protein